MNGLLKILVPHLLITHIGFSQAEIVEKVMAVVDDQMISLSQMRSYKKLLSSRVPYENKLFSLRHKNSLKKSQKALLNHLIDEKVLKSIIPLEQLNLPSKEQLFVQEMNKKKISRKSLTRDLKRIGFSLEEYQDIIYLNQAYNAWIGMEVSSSIQITAQDINDYYLATKGKNLFKKYKYELYQWKFPLSKKGKEDAENFLKKSYSKKSDMLILTDGEMNQQLKKSIPQLAIGQRSSVICFAQNCYVFQLINKTFLVEPTQEVAQIRDQLYQKTFISKFKNWMAEKRSSAVIKRYL